LITKSKIGDNIDEDVGDNNDSRSYRSISENME